MLTRFKILLPRIRILASFLMLVLLLHSVKWGTILPKRSGTVRLLLLAGAVSVLAMGLSVLRWHRVLAALGNKTKLSTLLRLYLASLFVGNFLPSTVGGDIIRANWLRSLSGFRDAVASVVLERLTGWVVLPIITITGLLLNPELLHLGSPSKVVVAIVLLTLIGLAVVITLGMSSPEVTYAEGRGFRALLSASRYGIRQLTTHPRSVVSVLSVSFAYQLAVVCTAIPVAHALGLSLSWTVMLAFVPAVAILQVVPVTIGGLGLREGAFVLFLRPLGVSTSQAVALGLLVYAINLLVSLLGAPAFAMGAPLNNDERQEIGQQGIGSD